MAKKARVSTGPGKTVETLTHEEAKRRNIPTAEHQSVMQKEAQDPLRVAYERRNKDLDPQLVWRGKDNPDWSDLVVQAPLLYIQEKVHPKALIDDLLRQSRQQDHEAGQTTADLFADFNGIPKGVDKTEFYQHDQNWSNRMILGDSLQVMASLAEREGLRGKIQCIYFDPPYGITFNSNFQWSTTSKTVSDGKAEHITREPEQVKAFRDTWRDGIHSYLTYVRDRLTVARDLLTDTGSIFVQIGDENVHRMRAVMDEVFGDGCFVVTFPVKKKGNQKSNLVDPVNDYLLWYGRSLRSLGRTKFQPLFEKRELDSDTLRRFSRVTLPDGREFPLEAVPDPQDDEKRNNYKEDPARLFKDWEGARLYYSGEQLTSGGERPNQSDPVEWEGVVYRLKSGLCWKTTTRTTDGTTPGMVRVKAARRLFGGRDHLNYSRYLDDFGYTQLTNWWDGLGGAPNAIYVVQTNEELVKRCILMTTNPGDLVLDPTCGSGTTAYVAEQWGRRWITMDTSRVALALARARVMGARYPYYLLTDSREGQEKQAALTRHSQSTEQVFGNVRHGFVYERVPHVTLGSIANNAEIDVIWAKWQRTLDPLREQLNVKLGKSWQEWEMPREAPANNVKWSESAKMLHSDFWRGRILRQQEIDASIAAKAEFEYLYDKPYTDNKRVRVAGPFTVESISPHRVLGVDANDELIDPRRVRSAAAELEPKQDFPQMILENLKTAGVQQAHKDDKIVFTSLTPWPGDLVCGEGKYREGNAETGPEKRAAIFIGPEFGTVTRFDLVAAAKEAGDSDFDMLIACAFNYEAHATEFSKLGRIQVLKARMNADLHMSNDLKNTGKGNLFVIFGEPDIEVLTEKDGRVRVKINGVDVFDPSSGEVRSDGADGIACWFIDTDYNEESFFVRQAYFLGANDPYGALKTTLKAEINEDAWATLHSDTSRPFMKPRSGRIAVKVINHLGDEVMRVFRV
jgi:adenine-specific DNA-methyltransferase